MRKTTLLIGLIWISLQSMGQYSFINTNSPRVPFGSNSKYEYGLMPSNLPTTGYYKSSQDAAVAYNDWKTEWVSTCTNGKQYVKWDGGATSVSEGIAYGMIIAAYMADKQLFDDLWFFYKQAKNTNGLMGWQANCSGYTQSGAASDAEVDAAMGLIIAAYQWPNATSPYTYKTEATTLITAIYNFEIQGDNKTGANQLLPGDMWGSAGDDKRNPGYISMGYFKMYAEFIGGTQKTDWETNIIPANYALIQSNVHPTTGLASNWCQANGATSDNFGDDACRFPWRTAVDVLWYNQASSKTICSNIAKFCASKGGPTTTPGRIALDGTGSGSTESIFRVMYAAGVVGANSSTVLSNGYTPQSLVDAYYTNTKNARSAADLHYFHQILRMISMLVQTGNFWRPGHETGQCARPDLGADASLCGVSKLTLNSALATATNRTFTWYNDGAVFQGPSASLTKIDITQKGVWKVEVDSSGCKSTDEITILDVLSAVDLGADLELCNPVSYLLDAKISGSGYVYEWKKGTAVVASTKTYTVTDAGTYTLKVSASNCASVQDQVIVTSLLPKIQHDTICSAGVATLKVLSTGGPYEWYATSTSTSPLFTGATYMPSISTSKTFYVKDAGSVTQKVGPLSTSNTLGSQTNAGAIGIKFTAAKGFKILSVAILPYIYSCGSSETVTLSLDLQDASGTTIKTYTATPVVCTGTQSTLPLTKYYTMVFADPIVVPASGDYILKPSAGNQLPWFQSGANYSSMKIDGLIQITGDTRTDNSVSYPAILDLQVSTGNDCARAPAYAVIDCITGSSVFSSEIENISFYPNPSTSSFMLESNENAMVFVRDINGKIVEQFETTNAKKEFGSSYEKGIYFMSVSTKNGLKTHKLIKQ